MPGTTSMIPTTLTSDKEDLLKTLDLYELTNKTIRKDPDFWVCIWKGHISHWANEVHRIHHTSEIQICHVKRHQEKCFPLCRYNWKCIFTRHGGWNHRWRVHLLVPLLQLIYKIKGRINCPDHRCHAGRWKYFGALVNRLKVIVENGITKLQTVHCLQEVFQLPTD